MPETSSLKSLDTDLWKRWYIGHRLWLIFGPIYSGHLFRLIVGRFPLSEASIQGASVIFKIILAVDRICEGYLARSIENGLVLDL